MLIIGLIIGCTGIVGLHGQSGYSHVFIVAKLMVIKTERTGSSDAFWYDDIWNDLVDRLYEWLCYVKQERLAESSMGSSRAV
ncbi:MAG: hypothetical protein ACLTDF_09270 [Coprococcus sp.]